MSAYWVNTGQLDRATVTTWADGGQDEHGFYELGTQASYGNNWDQTPRSAEADAPGWDDWAGVAETGVPSSVGVW